MHTFSICIPTKNRASSHLPELLNSISGQIIPEDWKIEIVICDDGSEKTEKILLYEILAKLKIDTILIEHEQSLGVAASRNSAVNACTGELITDIDDDDILLQDSIAKRINAQSDISVLWTFGNALKVDKNLKYKINKDLTPDWDVANKNKDNVIKGLLNQSIFYWASTRTYRREALFIDNKLVEWDSEFIVAQDLDHWVKLVELNGPPNHIDSYLIAWREKRHSWGINGRRSGMQQEMINKIKLKHSKYNQ